MKNLKTIALALGLISMTTFTSCSKDDIDAPEAEVPAVAAGTGTQTDAYNILAAKGNQGTKGNGKQAWVKGYIVGAAITMDIKKDAKFATPFIKDGVADASQTALSNIIIAASPTEKDYNNCVVVQLLNDNVKAAINLIKNEGNLGKEILISGKLEPYFGISGLKSTNACFLGDSKTMIGTTDVVTPPVTPPTDGAIFSETFAASLGNFTQVAVVGTEKWLFDSTYKCALVSGYSNSSNADGEYWFISPDIDLTNKATASLSFDQAFGFASNVADLPNAAQVYVSSKYTTGNINPSDWTKLAIPTYPTEGKRYTFANTGNITITGNSKIRIALKYISTKSLCPKWEVKNFVVK